MDNDNAGADGDSPALNELSEIVLMDSKDKPMSKTSESRFMLIIAGLQQAAVKHSVPLEIGHYFDNELNTTVMILQLEPDPSKPGVEDNNIMLLRFRGECVETVVCTGYPAFNFEDQITHDIDKPLWRIIDYVLEALNYTSDEHE